MRAYFCDRVLSDVAHGWLGPPRTGPPGAGAPGLRPAADPGARSHEPRRRRRPPRRGHLLPAELQEQVGRVLDLAGDLAHPARQRAVRRVDRHGDRRPGGGYRLTTAAQLLPRWPRAPAARSSTSRMRPGKPRVGTAVMATTAKSKSQSVPAPRGLPARSVIDVVPQTRRR